jgi:5'-nucleotidase
MDGNRMNILVTNDDGIESVGLWLLAAGLRAAGFGTVTIIAPDMERSGASMSVGSRPEGELYPAVAPGPEFEGLAAWSSTGTPAGCIMIGMLEAVAARPDVVVSGINPGVNTGSQVMLSGTVGAAMVAALWGVLALAVSAEFQRGVPIVWENAVWAATQVFPLLDGLRPAAGHPPLVLNVNVPHVAEGRPRGFRQTTLSDFFFGQALNLAAMTPAERNGHRLQFGYDMGRLPGGADPATDYGALKAGYVSVTPLAPMAVHPHTDIAERLESL